MTDHKNPLGQTSAYPEAYDPSLLFPMSRIGTREQLEHAASQALPAWFGQDQWSAFELSWCDAKGRVQVAALEFSVAATSPNILESKSVKLYLGSLASERFASAEEVLARLVEDLTTAAGTAVQARLIAPDQIHRVANPPGQRLQDQALEISTYERDVNLLQISDDPTVQTWYSDTFRSLCPVTGQPDFATMIIQYSGPTIIPASLEAYLTSYREHQGFHEFTVEQIYVDLWRRCQCESLLVRGLFLRRGGIDISPYRSSTDLVLPPLRLSRQ